MEMNSLAINKRRLTAVFVVLQALVMSAWSQREQDLQTILSLGLPVVEVTTVDGEEPTCDPVEPPEGCMGQGITNMNNVKGRLRILQGSETLYDSGDYEKDAGGMTIRVRGNSSAWQEKKPYKVKLQKKADLLLRGDDKKYKDKDWLLLKDETASLNTVVGMKVNELMGMQWTPRYMLVNLMLNDVYRGLYLIVESVKRNNDCRIDIDKETGYLFEYDPYWWNEDLYFETPMTASPDAKFTFKEPDSEDITEQQVDYIREVMVRLEASLGGEAWQWYVDTESFASWLLAQDILGNGDGHGSNVFMTKYDNSPQSKVMMGNLWDFDAIMQTPDTWSNSHRILYFGVLLDHPSGVFSRAYQARWNTVKGTLFTELMAFLKDFEASETGQAYDRSIPYDSYRCNREGKTLRQLTDEACQWLEARKQWLEHAINDTNFVGGATARRDSTACIYDLQGISLPDVSRKGIYIQNGIKVVMK